MARNNPAKLSNLILTCDSEVYMGFVNLKEGFWIIFNFAYL
jgi:hypothetical protein